MQYRADALCGHKHGQRAASSPKKKDEKEGPVPGLTGAKLLRCEPGFYPSGNACKPARPGTYVPGGATFPVLCPKGTTSEAKSRSVGECVSVK